jgi:hypothetical protein
MDGIEPKIEIFKPFGEAFELMKKILFQPFDLGKWCVIGFAVFLTHLNGGGFTGFRPPLGNNWTNHVASEREDIRSIIDQLGPIWLSVIGVGILVLIAIFIVLTWVRARGHFVFIDCIVRNRAAIVQPWNEYRMEGNSYFVFLLLVTLVILSVVAVFVVLIIAGVVLFEHRDAHAPVAVLSLILMGIGLFLFLALFGVVVQFVAPLMYRRRCKAWAAFVEIISSMGKHPGPLMLYFLFSIVLGIAVAIVAFTATCLTCCIAAIPYVGTVILLPIFVFMQSFLLLFLRQFGPDYDVWAGLAQGELGPAEGSSSPTPPPIQS